MAEMAEIQRLVAQQLGRRRVAPEDRIIEDLGAESLDVVNILAGIEDRHGVSIPEVELPDIQTVADLWAAVERHLGEPGP